MEETSKNNETPQLGIGAVIASFLSDKAKQYGVEQNKLLIDSNYGEIRLMRYDEGAYEKWKYLETIKERF
jgi:hypothetical protein